MNLIIPFLSSVISLIFAVSVFDQFLGKRKPHQLVWSLGLLAFFVSTGAEFYTAAYGTNGFAFRFWYLFGAIFSAAYMGMGTIYLLAPRRTAHIVMALLAAFSVFAVFKVFSSPVDLAVIIPGDPMTGKAFPSGMAGPRILTPFFNTFGTLALVGGAVYSMWVFWRRRLSPHRMVSNILIAVGAFLPALGGTFSRLGVPGFLYLSEFLGIVVIFLGFLRSQEIFGLYRFPLIHGFRRTSG